MYTKSIITIAFLLLVSESQTLLYFLFCLQHMRMYIFEWLMNIYFHKHCKLGGI